MLSAEITLSAVVEAFFADKDLSCNSLRAYHQTLDALVEDSAPDLPVLKLTPTKVDVGITWTDNERFRPGFLFVQIAGGMTAR